MNGSERSVHFVGVGGIGMSVDERTRIAVEWEKGLAALANYCETKAVTITG